MLAVKADPLSIVLDGIPFEIRPATERRSAPERRNDEEAAFDRPILRNEDRLPVLK